MTSSPSNPAPAPAPAAHYPRRRARRPLIVAAIALLAAVGLSWTVWAGLHHATPAVAARVKAWTIESDTQTNVTLTVDRSDARKPYRCTVYAQSPNFERVGEVSVDVAPADERVIDVPITIKTFRRATSVSFDKCEAA